MSYSTVIEVRNALSPGDWSDGNPPDVNSPTYTAADLSNAQLLDAIAEADAFIDSFIGGRYVVPVAVSIVDETEDGTPLGDVPHPIDYWSRNIAAYNATLTIRKSQDFADTDPVARRYNQTLLILTAVRNGTATLQIPENESPTSSEGVGQAVNRYQGTLFCPDDFDLVSLPASWPNFPASYLSQLDRW